MEERGVDSSRSGRDKERAFLYGAVNVHPPPPKKCGHSWLMQKLFASQKGFWSMEFVCLFVIWAVWCSADQVSVITHILSLRLLFWTHKSFPFPLVLLFYVNLIWGIRQTAMSACSTETPFLVSFLSMACSLTPLKTHSNLTLQR